MMHKMDGSLRDALRSGTRTAHARIDATFSAFDISSFEGYRDFLAAQAGALIPLEDALDRFGAGLPVADWPRRRRGEALMRDLEVLGTRATFLVAPTIGSDAEMVGMLYVLEGSRLGARLLRDRAMQSTCPQVQQACRFLDHGMGERLWVSFVATLDRIAASGIDVPAAIRGALAAFDLFENSARRTIEGAVGGPWAAIRVVDPAPPSQISAVA